MASLADRVFRKFGLQQYAQLGDSAAGAPTVAPAIAPALAALRDAEPMLANVVARSIVRSVR